MKNDQGCLFGSPDFIEGDMNACEKNGVAYFRALIHVGAVRWSALWNRLKRVHRADGLSTGGHLIVVNGIGLQVVEFYPVVGAARILDRVRGLGHAIRRRTKVGLHIDGVL